MLTNIIKKNVKVHWNAKIRKAFNDFKKKFSKKLILTNFDSKILEIVETNAFDRDIDEIYNQKSSNNKLKIVAFYSKKLSFAKQNYEIHDKELLIIVKCFKKWQIYLKKIKHKIQIYTDHKNLLYFITRKILNRKQIKWSKKLFKHNFIISYRKEENNEKIDTLNKRSNYFEKNETINKTILK